MRDIEFRAWHPRTGMHDAKKMTDNGLTMMFDGRVLYGNFVAESGWEIMQFTGLRDKNGVKIFCGDIVKWGENIETVSFDDGYFQTETSMIDSCMEVIGNIHQHPHLLEQKK